MRPLATAFILIAALSSCSKTEPTASEILEQSIAHHDPEGRWNNFRDTIFLKSTFGGEEQFLKIYLNNPQKEVRYENLSTGAVAHFKDSVCTSSKPEGDCSSYGWTRNFYHFILGLPMTLNTPDAVIGEQVVTDTIGGEEAYRINIDFEQERWHFFFDKETSALRGFAFNKNYEAKAERIVAEGLYEVGPIHFVKKRTWWDTTDSSKVVKAGVDEIVFSEKSGN